MLRGPAQWGERRGDHCQEWLRKQCLAATTEPCHVSGTPSWSGDTQLVSTHLWQMHTHAMTLWRCGTVALWHCLCR
jgi:hypothetical protein